MGKERIQRPYCRVDGTVYKLGYKNGVLRFPDDGRRTPDLNRWVIEYANGKRPLSDLWDHTVNSGSSYEYTYGIFGTHGQNNHIVTQGKEPTKSFRLYDSKDAPWKLQKQES